MKRSLIAALAVCLCAAAASLLLAFYRDAKDVAVVMLREEQRTHAEHAARGIEAFFTTWFGALSAYARLSEIVDIDDVGRRDMRVLLESRRGHVRGISRVDEQGTILASYPFGHVEGCDISRQAHVEEILRDHRPVVSDVFRSVQGFDAVAVHVPVFAGTSFRGTLAVLVNFASLAGEHLDVIRIGETGHAWMVSRDATLLYSRIPGLTGTSAAESFKSSPSLLAMLADMLKGQEGAVAYSIERDGGKGSETVMEYAVFLPVRFANTFWSVAVASEERELVAALGSVRNRLTLLVGMLCLGAVLLAIVATKAWVIVKGERARKLGDQSLRESEARFSTVFHASPAAIALTDLSDNRVIDVNEAWQLLTGYERREIVGCTTTDLNLWVDTAQRDSILRALYEQGTARDVVRIRRKSGEFCDALLTAAFVDLSGRRQLLTMTLDITQLRQAEAALLALNAELARSNGELERFGYSVSHDLKEPVRMVASYSNLLANRYRELLDDDGRDFLGYIQEGAERMQLMIDDLLRYSRVTTRGESFAPVALGEVLQDALDNLAIALKETGGAVVHDELPTVLGDRSQLMQLFQNLIDNAVKFRRPGVPPRIAIGAQLQDRARGVWTISVRDNGIGIEAKFLERIFVVFQRLHTKEDYPGSGIGLALCRRIVERHGGRIWVESTPAEGSTFFFTLPEAT